jgi:hypothetical protein
MRYLLVVGFFCDIYRREPRARLFFNDQLIDEFNIKNQTEIKNLKQPWREIKHPLEPISIKDCREHYIKSLPILRFYELDVDKQLKQTSVRVDILNDDSNFTNGFISKSTLLKFSFLSLFPVDKKIYKWFNEKKNDRRNSSKYPWYRRDRINYFFTANHNLYNKIIWVGNNLQKIQGDVIKEMKLYSIGGSGSLHCEFIKKYGILLPRFLDPIRPYIYSIDSFFHDVIYAKYEHYVNQRDNN